MSEEDIDDWARFNSGPVLINVADNRRIIEELKKQGIKYITPGTVERVTFEITSLAQAQARRTLHDIDWAKYLGLDGPGRANEPRKHGPEPRPLCAACNQVLRVTKKKRCRACGAEA